jgi:hypothetical protein
VGDARRELPHRVQSIAVSQLFEGADARLGVLSRAALGGRELLAHQVDLAGHVAELVASLQRQRPGQIPRRDAPRFSHELKHRSAHEPRAEHHRDEAVRHGDGQGLRHFREQRGLDVSLLFAVRLHHLEGAHAGRRDRYAQIRVHPRAAPRSRGQVSEVVLGAERAKRLGPRVGGEGIAWRCVGPHPANAHAVLAPIGPLHEVEARLFTPSRPHLRERGREHLRDQLGGALGRGLKTRALPLHIEVGEDAEHEPRREDERSGQLEDDTTHAGSAPCVAHGIPSSFSPAALPPERPPKKNRRQELRGAV